MLKAAFFGIGTVLAGGVMLATWGSLAACHNLDVTSPLFDPDAATDYDAGFVPEPADEGEDPGGELPEVTPNTVRVRLANLFQGGESMQLCFAQGTSTTFTVARDVATGTQLDAVPASALSAPVSIGLIPEETRARFAFRVGPNCAVNGAPNVVATLATPGNYLGGTSVTLIAAGDPEAQQGEALFPQLTVVTDLVSPPATSTSFRAFHGAVDFPPFDVVINGQPVLQGIRYNTGIGYPYTSANGFATIAAGIPEGSTLRLVSGTTTRSFTVPERIRRGIAESLLVTGTSRDNVSASLCSDRAPEGGGATADCISLPPAN